MRAQRIARNRYKYRWLVGSKLNVQLTTGVLKRGEMNDTHKYEAGSIDKLANVLHIELLHKSHEKQWKTTMCVRIS